MVNIWVACLTLICEVIRYRLVQVRQNLKKNQFFVHQALGVKASFDNLLDWNQALPNHLADRARVNRVGRIHHRTIQGPSKQAKTAFLLGPTYESC